MLGDVPYIASFHSTIYQRLGQKVKIAVFHKINNLDNIHKSLNVRQVLCIQRGFEVTLLNK